MKLSIAIAFSHHAELFILDEPTSGLDPIVRNEVLDVIQEELIDEKNPFLFLHISFQIWRKLLIIWFISRIEKSF